MTGVPCCKDKGIPRLCYALCMHPESSDELRLDSRRPHFCTKYESKAAECELGPRGGKYNELILVYTIFLKIEWKWSVEKTKTFSFLFKNISWLGIGSMESTNGDIAYMCH